MNRISSTDEGLRKVLYEAYKRGFTVKSDLARFNAEYVAMAASMGLLTTHLFNDNFSSEWRVSPEGLAFLEMLMDRLGEPDPYEDD